MKLVVVVAWVGVGRGECEVVGCECKEFVRGSTGPKCDECKHSPVRHKELNPISIPAQASPTTIVVSAQSDTPAQQLNPDSTHYIAAPQVIQQQGISQQPQPIQPMQQPQFMQQPQLIQQPQPMQQPQPTSQPMMQPLMYGQVDMTYPHQMGPTNGTYYM